MAFRGGEEGTLAVGCYFARRVTNRTTCENKYMPEPLPEPAAYLALFCSSQSSWRGATVHHTYLNGSWLPIEVQPVLHSQRQGLLLVLLAGVVLVASATCRKATIVRQQLPPVRGCGPDAMRQNKMPGEHVRNGGKCAYGQNFRNGPLRFTHPRVGGSLCGNECGMRNCK